ncbi:major facilitator superfamily domain-containing protein [Emericellopsis atlantica]|uniref:Major facilitator superfamily domain-containing protein n=1 Tax=Emericellopsis atlantica TaxID=2614577 RepID=A0A9P7ZH42_9HYPO|nr:major facilitator superfamily domain-containing protein [Emericellopsis atlantica]KAG9251905.1 major facilitator superfamily domain-containing protein [Emericellopsis atlantica]
MAFDAENIEHKDATPRSASADHHEKEVSPMVEALDDDPVYSYKEQRKIIGRVDRRLITVAGIIYMNSLMDRSNLPNAGIAGMNVDLGMVTGFRYSAVALVFFITYTFLQPPATILTRKLGPRPFLSGICFAWGVVMVGFGFVNDWVVLIPLRLLLGLFEAGYFPGIVYLISTWYSRYDMHKRYAGFYCLGLVASGLGGILAFGVQQMDGLGGLEGWRWIFIIFGLMTVAASFLGMVFLVDFPDVAIDKNHWKFISRDEIALIMRRIAKDRNDASSEKFNVRRWAAAGKDWKLWVFAMQFFSLTTQAYALAFFLPIILNSNMGFSVALSQLLTAPPYAGAGLVMFLCAWVGDKYHVRGPLLLFTASLGLIGLPLLAYAEAVGARYFGCFLICAASNGGIPTVMAYQANNIRGQWKRAFASATLVGFGGLGGIAGSTVFRSQDAPQYIPGIWVCIGLNILIVCTTIINTIIFRKQNTKADRGEVVLEGEASFRYTV